MNQADSKKVSQHLIQERIKGLSLDGEAPSYLLWLFMAAIEDLPVEEGTIWLKPDAADAFWLAGDPETAPHVYWANAVVTPDPEEPKHPHAVVGAGARRLDRGVWSVSRDAEYGQIGGPQGFKIHWSFLCDGQEFLAVDGERLLVDPRMDAWQTDPSEEFARLLARRLGGDLPAPKAT